MYNICSFFKFNKIEIEVEIETETKTTSLLYRITISIPMEILATSKRDV